MMLSTHSNMTEEVEDWARLRFGPCQTEIHTSTISYSSEPLEETPVQRLHAGGNEAIIEKRRMLEKRVSFPSDESMLVQNLEPPVPDVPGFIF